VNLSFPEFHVTESHTGGSAIFVSEIEATPPPTLSNAFQKYVNFRPLTSGGKAVLRVCKDTNLGRDVVIKQLRPKFKDDPLELKRLLREARITAQLQHPGTVPVYEIGQDTDNCWYFTMKRVSGETLFQILVRLSQQDANAVKYFTLHRLLAIFLQVCDTLAFAHSRGIIHRDIKPENVLIGFFGEAVLLDWGSAKVWGMPNESGEDTIHDRGGTPLYMSPEQVSGHWHIDERTDIWSLGVVLYELLAIREPFRGVNVRATLANIMTSTPESPSQLAPERAIPSRLEEICLKAMAKEPNDRYESVSKMAQEIREFKENSVPDSSD